MSDKPSKTEIVVELLRQYLPGYVLDNLLSGRDVRGERKVVTVLFADISGFTSMSEKMDPEDVTRVMNGCFEVLVEEVFRHKGTVDKFIGDCLMAMWGVPDARENDAELAVRCAVSMLEALERYNSKLETPLGLSTGINMGVAVAATVGSSRFRQFTVMGDTVNLAQRLESAADRGQILVSQSIRDACENIIEFLTHEPITVKGKSKPVANFSPLRIRSDVDQVELRQRSEIALLGRDELLQQFNSFLQEASHNKGSSILLHGESGIGKSSLLPEAARLSGQYRFQVASGTGHELQQNVDFGILAGLIRRLCKIREADDERAARKKIQVFAPGIASRQEQILAQLCGVECNTELTTDLDPMSRKLAITDAVCSCFVAASSRQPLLLLLDDLHFGDPATFEVLSRVYRMQHNTPILVIAAFRSDQEARSIDFYHSLNVAPLPGALVSQLAGHLLERDQVPDNLIEFLQKRGKGNPLYIEQLIEGLKRSGKIFLKGNQWRVDANIEDTDLPDNLNALMANRIDALPPEKREIVQMAATIGPVVDAEILRQLSGRSGSQGLIEQLVREGILRELPYEERASYGFNHPLLLETAYERILKDTRRAWHGQIASLLAIDSPASAKAVARIADHYARSANIDRADEYLARAVLAFEEESALNSAFNYAAARVDLLKSDEGETAFPEDEHRQRMADAELVLGRAARLAGDPDQARASLERAIEIGSAAGIPAVETGARLELGTLLRETGDYGEAEQQLRLAASVTMSGTPHQQLRLALETAAVVEAKGDAGAAYQTLKQALTSIKGPDDRSFLSMRIQALNRLGVAALKMGNLEEASARFNQALKVARARDNRVEEARAYANIAGLYATQNVAGKAVQYARRALEIAEQVGDLYMAARQYYNLATFSAAAGHGQAARDQLNRAETLASEIRWKEGLAMISVLKPQLPPETS